MKNKYDHIQTVFIGGCPRSGTTLLGSLLGSAPQCVTTPESQFKQSIPSDLKVDWNRGLSRSDFLRALKTNFRFKLWDIDPPGHEGEKRMKAQEYRAAILSLVDAYAFGEGIADWNVWIDHTPENIIDPVSLMKVFPETKFLHIVRDPRAVAASILPLDWGPSSACQAARFWAQKLSYGQALERSRPDKCMRVCFEDVVRSPAETLRSVCAFCGIAFNEAMLAGDGFKPPAYTRNQHSLIGSMPDPGRLDAWRNRLDPWQIEDIEKIVGDLMELTGYARSPVTELGKRPWVGRVARRLMLPVATYLKKKRHGLKKKYYGRFYAPAKVSRISKK
ncbi:MAG: sulfotransferase [Smithellaceae bacterium]